MLDVRKGDAMDDSIKFRGVIASQRYYNDDSFYGVFAVRTTDSTLPYKDEITQPNAFEDDEGYMPRYIVIVAGKMQQLYVGSEYEFIAMPTYSSKYKSWQYEPITVTAIAPSSYEASKLFLDTILTTRQSETLLAEYPDIIQQIIDGKDDVDVHKLKGIGDKSYTKIKDKIIRNYVISDIITLLQPYGVSYTAIKSLLKWESNSAILKQKIKNNPYELINARGFGFLKTDKIALSLQPELVDSSKRLFAFLRYILNKEAEDNGHTWVDFTQLNTAIIDQIPQCKELFDKLVEENKDGLFSGYFYINNNRIGLRRYWENENAIYDILKYLNTFQFNRKINTEAGIKKAEKELGYELSEDQRNVVRRIETDNVIVYGGHSGAGKTSVARAILSSFPDSIIACCSLSAKAAQRIQEATGFGATTAHRMLGFKHGTFVYNSRNRLIADVIFIDEASMINCGLFYDIISAVKEGAKVVICGDYAQLPPIGAGNIFSDLLHMKNDFNVSVLTKVHRQAEKSGILRDANMIRKGEFPIEKPEPMIVSGENRDMVYIFRDDPERIQNIVVGQFIKTVESKGLDSVVCIAPRKDTVINSALEINNRIQEKLIDTNSTPHIQGYRNEFYIGDRVIQIENDSDRDVYNGEVGFVEAVFPNAKSEETLMTVRFKSTLANEEDKLVNYNREDLKTVLLAYALTVHKSQGSEYDYVIVVIDKTHYTLLDNCLLYTAITRAKKMCILVAQPEAFKRAMKNNFNRNRQTWLRLKFEEVDQD